MHILNQPLFLSLLAIIAALVLVSRACMASTLDVSHLRSRLFVKSYDFDPDTANATDVAWVSARDWEHFLFQFFRTIGTGAIDTLQVLANTKVDGSGTDVIVKTKSLTGVQPDALADQTFIEVKAEEIRQALRDANLDSDDITEVGISLQVEFATATDEGVVTYVFGGSRFPRAALTADIIA